jgi:hypothetical protein
VFCMILMIASVIMQQIDTTCIADRYLRYIYRFLPGFSFGNGEGVVVLRCCCDGGGVCVCAHASPHPPPLLFTRGVPMPHHHQNYPTVKITNKRRPKFLRLQASSSCRFSSSCRSSSMPATWPTVALPRVRTLRMTRLTPAPPAPTLRTWPCWRLGTSSWLLASTWR